MTTRTPPRGGFEHKGLGEGLGGPVRAGPYAGGAGAMLAAGVEFGAPCLIDTLDGQKLRPTRGVETKQASDPAQLLAAARARLAGGDDGDDDAEEDVVISYHEPPTPGPDEQVVLEAPLESLTEQTRKTALAAQLVAEARLPRPGLPPGVRVRFHTPYSRSMREIYEGIAERPVVPFLTGKGWAGHFDPDSGEVWVDVGRHAGELPRHVLHELCHSWRERTPEAGRMTAEQKEQEAWDFAEAWLPEVLALLNTPDQEW